MKLPYCTFYSRHSVYKNHFSPRKCTEKFTPQRTRKKFSTHTEITIIGMYPAPKYRHIISHDTEIHAGNITGDIKDIGCYHLKTKELLLTINPSIYAKGNRRSRISAVRHNRIKQSFKRREGTVNLYRNGAFLCVEGCHPTIFSAYKSGGVFLWLPPTVFFGLNIREYFHAGVI